MHCRNVYVSLLILAVSLMAGCVKTSIPDPRGLGAAPVKCSSPVDILGILKAFPTVGMPPSTASATLLFCRAGCLSQGTGA